MNIDTTNKRKQYTKEEILTWANLNNFVADDLVYGTKFERGTEEVIFRRRKDNKFNIVESWDTKLWN